MLDQFYLVPAGVATRCIGVAANSHDVELVNPSSGRGLVFWFDPSGSLLCARGDQHGYLDECLVNEVEYRCVFESGSTMKEKWAVAEDRDASVFKVGTRILRHRSNALWFDPPLSQTNPLRSYLHNDYRWFRAVVPKDRRVTVSGSQGSTTPPTTPIQQSALQTISTESAAPAEVHPLFATHSDDLMPCRLPRSHVTQSTEILLDVRPTRRLRGTSESPFNIEGDYNKYLARQVHVDTFQLQLSLDILPETVGVNSKYAFMSFEKLDGTQYALVQKHFGDKKSCRVPLQNVAFVYPARAIAEGLVSAQTQMMRKVKLRTTTPKRIQKLRIRPISSADYDALAVVGNGLSVKRSHIKKGGYGLYADRGFVKNEVITGYAGFLIHKELSSKLTAAKLDTHIVRVAKYIYIDGIRNPKMRNIPGAQFANEGNHLHRNNAKLATLEVGSLRNTCVLVATRKINPGEEIFAFYGRVACNVYHRKIK